MRFYPRLDQRTRSAQRRKHPKVGHGRLIHGRSPGGHVDFGKRKLLYAVRRGKRGRLRIVRRHSRFDNDGHGAYRQIKLEHAEISARLRRGGARYRAHADRAVYICISAEDRAAGRDLDRERIHRAHLEIVGREHAVRKIRSLLRRKIGGAVSYIRRARRGIGVEKKRFIQKFTPSVICSVLPSRHSVRFR